MEYCLLNITTSVDGQESEFSCKGTLSLSTRSATLSYSQENALVTLVLDGESATIDRVGDYSLRLPLKKGERSVGMLGLGESGGEIVCFSHKITYSISKNSLLAFLHYDLYFGQEIQEMKLRILARYTK